MLKGVKPKYLRSRRRKRMKNCCRSIVLNLKRQKNEKKSSMKKINGRQNKLLFMAVVGR